MLLEQGMIALPVHDPGHAIGDQKMLTLPLALDPLHMARVLRELMDAPASAAQMGRARPAWTLQAIQVRRHKPGRRCLIEYELLEPASGKKLSLLGKIRAKGLDRKSYLVQEALWRNGFDEASPDGIFVPEPLGYVPHLAMWLQKKVAAQPVITGLDGADGLALARRIAEAVHKLHRLGPPPGRVHTMDDELRILREQLEGVSLCHFGWKNRIEKILAGCSQLGHSLPPGTPCPSQRDCYHDNILFHGSRIVLVDLDLYCLADPGLDLGNCIAHLMDYSLRSHQDASYLRAVEEAIASRFAALTGHACQQQLAVYTTLSLARLIAISTRIPERKKWTAALMELCEHRIKEHCL